MEGDYLELSQFPYNSYQFPYNSHQSPLGTTGFLTSGIRAVDPETSNCDQRKLLKEIQQLLNKALEEVKDISKKMKVLAESNMAMKEELSRMQEDLENMSEEEFQFLGAMEAGVQVTKTKEELEKNQLVEINPGLLAEVTCISINKSILQKYASEDVSLGSRFTGLEVEHIDEHVSMQVGFIGEVVLKDYPGLLKKWDLMLLSGAKVDLGLGYGDQVSLLRGNHQGRKLDSPLVLIRWNFVSELGFESVEEITFPSWFEKFSHTWLLLCGKPKLMYQEGLLATIWKAATYDSPFEALTMTYGVLNAQGHVQVLGGNSRKCQDSNASIAFPCNGMYLANVGSLGFLRLEHVEGHQELSLETMLFTTLSTQGKQKRQCNETFTELTRQYYYCESTCAVSITVHIGCYYNSFFNAEDNTETRCRFSMSAGIKTTSFSDYATLFWAVVKCLEIFDEFDGQDALAYWISGRFLLMKVSLNNNTLWARCFQGKGNVRNMK